MGCSRVDYDFTFQVILLAGQSRLCLVDFFDTWYSDKVSIHALE